VKGLIYNLTWNNELFKCAVWRNSALGVRHTVIGVCVQYMCMKLLMYVAFVLLTRDQCGSIAGNVSVVLPCVCELGEGHHCGSHRSDDNPLSGFCPLGSVWRLSLNTSVRSYDHAIHGSVIWLGLQYRSHPILRRMLLCLPHVTLQFMCSCTAMRRITTFRSATDRMYDGGPIT